MTEPPAEAPTDAPPSLSGADSPDGQTAAYRVLARKYRPLAFDQLIGQDALVRTLTNAVKGGRLAQAYMLTGVRGVGKTTTARLIARALNCIGPDGTGGVTIAPCGVCSACTAIMADRHVDVMEMDAASRTGVNDIREILDGVRYRPTSARYKVYIIDEVHMLSNQAFNALLKTLEEPPEHVKFIFATTEIRKVPVTVLSRCQRFDLRRVEQPVLAAHFARIAEREGSRVEEGALALIARAADGSVRDGLSLLDQAIAHGDGTVTEEQVRDMLGLADRTVVFDLFEAVMKGDVAQALDIVAAQYALGADPLVVVQDLLELTHWLTRLKAVKGGEDDPTVPEAERTRGREMSGTLSMASLTRAWQMLLKGLGEARMAPDPLQAVEMALIRLAYAADLPPPGDVVARLGRGGAGAGANGGGAGAPSGGGAPAGAPTGGPGSGGGGGLRAVAGSRHGTEAPDAGRSAPEAQTQSAPQAQIQSQPQPSDTALPMPTTFKAVAELARSRREARIAKHLTHDVHLVAFEPGRIEFNPGPEAPRDLAGRLGAALQDWTGRRWVVMVSDRPGAETLHDQLQADVLADPLVQAVLELYPEARIGSVRERAGDATAPVDTGAAAVLPGGDDDDVGAGDAGPDGTFFIMSDDESPAFGGFGDGFGDDDT
ncbi:DNA polymerase III subunit gamma/tau [Roseospira marina]|uniref:DNA polymerase III subunit gamma/tau n=1 Tax=Roseospira marina TaxID=140057 RepID=A0A5M6IBY2_9PROT|nr:DNA polymerase III subunit gamma/tau [Roseospira marina]KAA5605800.1 DNA polymerase III subunit gamma/tau [Roseospira marina]MBB4313615.1 DNA polymerase-3 subunit gamma/tau [Roseospira marina]MBB5086777.1 DNA polymerase-3 subunit gamma/tau [Roseospira marina]